MPALRGRRLAAALLGLWLVLWHAHSRVAEGLELGPAFSRWAYVAILVGAAGLCAWRAVLAAQARAAWVLFALGIIAWAAGDAYFTAEMWDDPSPPVPSPADAGYLLLPPLVLAGIVCLLRAHARGLSRAQWADGIAAGLAVGALSAAVSVDAVIEHLSGSPLQIATNVAYPVADVVLLSVIAGAIAGTGWRPDATLWTLALGVALFALADSLYVVQVAEATYDSGGWLDAGWSVGIWLIGVAACQAPMQPARTRAPEALRPIVVPLAFGSAALALLVYGCLAGLNAVATLFAAACLLAVMGRLLVTFRENVGMLRASQRKALADPLTGLGDRRALHADLAEALEAVLGRAEHRALVLLELDGVREFNDALGRHAGDALLVRLASRLSALGDPDAVAYRTRGREFAVLSPLPGAGGARALADRLAASLAERIEGIQVGCRAVGVELGREVTTVAAALRLADQRLNQRRAALQTA